MSFETPGNDALIPIQQVSIHDLEPHPQNAAIYGHEDVSALADQIAASNWIKPLVVSRDNMHIISGHRRWLAARQLGISRVPVEYRHFATEADELELLLLENASRDKTPEQKVREGEAWARLEREKAELRRRAAQNNDAGARLKAEVANLPPQETGKTREIVAEKIGMKPRTYEKAARVVAHADVLKATGRTDEAQALLTTLNEKSVHAAFEAITKPVRSEEKRREAQGLPDDVFNVVYADPAWEYNNVGLNGAANHHYSTMRSETIYNLPRQLGLCVADNAVLFLWVTNPFLQEGLECISRWGFVYKTHLVWVKTELEKPGIGWYVRGRHELLLIATRGSFTPLNEHISPPIGSVLEAPIREHSRKPDEVYEIIERLYPNCNYIELFARHRRDGWHSWGDEVDG